MGGLTGLDLGSRALKAVSLSRSKEGYALAGIATQELSFPEEEVPRDEFLAEELRKFAKSGGLKMGDVAVSLSGEFATVQPAAMPKMGREELRNVLPLEIEQYLTINPEENIIDFHIAGDAKEDETKMNVILAAGRTDAAESLYKVVSAAKLTCQAIDVDEIALMNMFELNYSWDEDFQKVVCLLNIGHRTTSLLIFDEAQLKYSRSISVAGESLTKDIQRDFALKPEQAEDLKREQAKIVIEEASSFSLSMFDREDRSLRIFETISGSLNKMLGEIKRVFDYYDTKSKGRSVERVLLAGGGAKLKGMDAFLASKVGVTVDYADPFRQIRMPAKGNALGVVESNAASFGVSVGLALRKF